MADETQEETITTEEVTGAEPGQKTEKTFSQLQMDAIVKDRVSREQRATKRLQDEMEVIKTAHEEELAKYKKVFDAELTVAKKSLPDAVKTLLDKLDPIEQMEWLANPENTKAMERKRIPETPKVGEQEHRQQKRIPSPI